MIVLKRITIIVAAIALLCQLVACGHPTEYTQPMQTTESVSTIPPTQAPTDAPTEAPTEVPTDPPVEETARELIREGKYEDAIALLENAEGDEAQQLLLRANLGEVTVGEEVIFGHYEQDNDLDNGMEEVSWIVLKVEDNKALVISRECLDTQPYHDVLDGRSDWANCTLRLWLNETFQNTAFDETEQCMILETELVNKDNASYRTPGGENTVDSIFLLSSSDAFAGQGQKWMISKVTPYAAASGCYVSPIGTGWWWLRSPGVYTRDASYVSSTGGVSDYGYIIHRVGWAVRPAMWIDLSV